MPRIVSHSMTIDTGDTHDAVNNVFIDGVPSGRLTLELAIDSDELRAFVGWSRAMRRGELDASLPELARLMDERSPVAGPSQTERLLAQAEELREALSRDARFTPLELETFSMMGFALAALSAENERLRAELARERPLRGVFSWSPGGDL